MLTPGMARQLGRARIVGSLALVAALGTGCKTADLSPAGAEVAASRNAPPPGCTPVGYLTGKGGGTFGGDLISNEDLIEYALNDLRNKAAGVGANYVQHDPPGLGSGDGTTTSVTITGTAYRCEDQTAEAGQGEVVTRG